MQVGYKIWNYYKAFCKSKINLRIFLFFVFLFIFDIFIFITKSLYFILLNIFLIGNML